MTKLFLTDREVGEVFGIGRATVWRWVKENKLPQPVRLSARCTRWLVEDIEQCVAETAAALRGLKPTLPIHAFNAPQSHMKSGGA